MMMTVMIILRFLICLAELLLPSRSDELCCVIHMLPSLLLTTRLVGDLTAVRSED